MIAYVVNRVLSIVPVVLIVAVVVFALIHLSPGDPAVMIAGDDATAADIERIRVQLGIGLPLYEQFAIWAARILQGDLGNSIFSRQPVSTLIAQRFEPTLVLAASTMMFSVLVAVPIGALAAWRAGSWIDKTVMGTAVLGFSIPVFIVGYGLIWLLSIKFDLLPVQGYAPLRGGVWGTLQTIAMPTIALGFAYVALIARITRAAVLEMLHKDFIRTARAKGLSEIKVLVRHALANSAIPIVTTVGIGFAMLVGGVVVVESVFAIPGIGRLTVDAILRRDYPIVQGVILLFSGIYILINLAVDLSYTYFDPRIRY